MIDCTSCAGCRRVESMVYGLILLWTVELMWRTHAHDPSIIFAHQESIRGSIPARCALYPVRVSTYFHLCVSQLNWHIGCAPSTCPMPFFDLIIRWAESSGFGPTFIWRLGPSDSQITFCLVGFVYKFIYQTAYYFLLFIAKTRYTWSLFCQNKVHSKTKYKSHTRSPAIGQPHIVLVSGLKRPGTPGIVYFV